MRNNIWWSYTYNDIEKKELLPNWICSECGYSNNISSISCSSCKTPLNQVNEKLIKEITKSNLKLQYPNSQTTSPISTPHRRSISKWRCNDCNNINSCEHEICLQCQKKQINNVSIKYFKKGVDV